MKRLLLLLLILLSSFFTLHLSAQSTNSAYWSYIQQYNTLAQEQMVRYRIPASITLAQGLLESGAGRSSLATKANNHFGIKVSSDWNGPYVVRPDDGPRDKFRKYSSVRESYEDHSKFLQKPRYAELFKLSITDYKPSRLARCRGMLLRKDSTYDRVLVYRNSPQSLPHRSQDQHRTRR